MKVQYLIRMLLFSLLVGISGEGYAISSLPDPDLVWKNISVGGKKTTVFCLFSDSRGLMWLGTNSGLYFYDGISTHAVGDNEMFGVQIYAIVENNGYLYMGSNNGLLRYEYSTGKMKPIEEYTPKEIRSLLLIDNTLWIGSLYGIYKLDTTHTKIEDCSEGLPHKSVYSILRDSRGIIYVGTYNGLARWDSAKKRFHKVAVSVGSEKQKNIFVNCLIESDDNETIYLGSEGELYRYSPSQDRWEKVVGLEGNNIKSIAKLNSDHLLIGTDNGVFDLQKDTLKHYRHDSRHEQTLSDNEIWCIYPDSKNNIWTGHERGISIASNSNSIRIIKLSTLVNSGEGNEIHSIFRDSHGVLWLGGTNGVLALNGKSHVEWFRHTEKPHSLSHNRIRSIVEDTDRNLWILTDGGLNRYNTQLNNFDSFRIIDEKGEHITNWVYALAEEDDYFWVGSFLGGLHYISKNKFNNTGGTVMSDRCINADTPSEFNGSPLGNDLVNDIVKDRKGNLWILLFRDNTLTKYDSKTGKVRKFDIYELTGSYPTNICMDDSGLLWCAFRGGVVCVNDKEDIRIINFPFTGSDEAVLSMGKVGKDIWVSTQSNVWKIDIATKIASLLPIPQKPYTALYEDTKTGKVILGGLDEILEVDPNNLENAVEIRSIKMLLNDRGNGQLNLSELKNDNKRIKIPYGGSLTLIVSSLDYSPEAVQRYLYKLADTRADTIGGWIIMPEGANTIALSDLKMGEYEILIKTLGSPIAPVAVPLTVLRPAVLSWWAICIYLFAAMGIIGGIIWYMRKRNARLFQEEERKKTIENVERKLTFLSNISHDLKTPLSMILGPVSILKEQSQDKESKKSLEIVYDNAVRLNNMIHKTLELHNLEDDDEYLLINSVFDVVEFCKGVFERFKENNPQKKFIFHSSCSQLLIEADAVKFESIITNLLSNACKYSEDDSTITFGINQHEGKVEIVVSDDGIGIDEIDQPLVFQRMFRAPATAKLHEGTGIGLYLIKRYLEKMGGTIELYSRKGEGSSFMVTLPLSDKVNVAVSNEMEDEKENKPKILIVEDNPQISAFIKDILKRDYKCLIAENGRAGLSVALSFIPDLIILDEMMPVMNGLEMAKRLKQNVRLTSIPIILLTAKSDNKTENESVIMGIDIFMTKPFEPAVLIGRISQLIHKKQELQESFRIQSIAEAKPIEAESLAEKQIAKIAKIIEDNISDPDLNVNLLCEKSGIPNKQLYRVIKKYMGIGPLDYIRRVRLQKAAMLLGQHRFTVAEISYMVGFKTPSYFAKCFQSQFGVKPSQYESEDENISAK